MSQRNDSGVMAWAAAVSAVAMIAHLNGGKAIRDALYLSNYHVSWLPWMMIVTALVTMLVTLAASSAMRRFGPARVVPAAYLASAGLHLVECGLLGSPNRGAAAVVLYLHISAAPVFISGFWSILSEGTDPRANRRQMARAAFAGSVGGVMGGVLAWSGDLAVRLLVLAGLDLICAVATFTLGGSRGDERALPEGPAVDASPSSTPSGRGMFRSAPYLGYLAIAMALFAASAALLEYCFKAQVQSSFPAQADLQKVFAKFYTSTALASLLVQLVISRWALRRIGLVPTAAALPAGVVLTGAGALVAPGLTTAAIARGSEFVIRNSLFRSAYEPLFNAIPSRLKNASKAMVDVGCDKLGDIFGASVAKALLVFGALVAARLQLISAIALSAGGLVLARLIHVGYQETLRKNLAAGGVTIPIDIYDSTTKFVIDSQRLPRPVPPVAPVPPTPPRPDGLSEILPWLESDRVVPRELIPKVIPLLADDRLAGTARRALRRSASDDPNPILEALLDPGLDLALRCRIPRVLAGCPSAPVVEGLLTALTEPRFVLRYECGNALARMRAKGMDARVDPARVYELVMRETQVERRVWEAQRPFDRREDHPETALVDDRLRQRANRSLEHVFNLLSVVLPQEPLLIAFHALHTEDPSLRGVALEYLESLLPRRIREKLWPFLDTDAGRTPSPRSREAALDALLASHQSIEISLTAIHRRLSAPRPDPS